jgi:hypothetical protein
MRRQLVTLLLLASVNVCSLAAQFKVGDKIDIKEDSMWFPDQISLIVWQRFAKVASPEVLESYRDVVLGCRAAWQFLDRQTVKIRRSDILARSCFASVANIATITSLNGPVESSHCS